MAHGTWFMVHGTWYMVNGKWYMVHGTWYMVHGTWYMAHGTSMHLCIYVSKVHMIYLSIFNLFIIYLSFCPSIYLSIITNCEETKTTEISTITAKDHFWRIHKSISGLKLH